MTEFKFSGQKVPFVATVKFKIQDNQVYPVIINDLLRIVYWFNCQVFFVIFSTHKVLNLTLLLTALMHWIRTMKLSLNETRRDFCF